VLAWIFPRLAKRPRNHRGADGFGYLLANFRSPIEFQIPSAEVSHWQLIVSAELAGNIESLRRNW